MNIYERIKTRRIELNMTQEELALKVGYKSRSAINKIEKGLRDINQSQIFNFAKALNTTTSYLLDGDASTELTKRTNSLSYSDKNILNKYNKLNNNGQIKAESYIDGLLENPSYVKKEKNSTAHNSDDFVLDESILGTDYNLVANVGISEPPKVKKKGTHT